MTTPMAENPSANNSTIKLTQDDVEKMKTLPKRTFIIGNIKQTGLYDENSKRFYFLDSSGKWTGRLAIINTPPAPPPPPENPAEPEESEEPPVHEPEAAPQPRAKARRKRDRKAGKDKSELNASRQKVLDALMVPISKKIPVTRMHVLVAAVIVFLIIMFLIIPAVNNVFSAPTVDTPPTHSTQITEEQPGQAEKPGISEQEAHPINTIKVIQARGILIPGDEISQENIQEAEISATDYELLRANGRVLYQWDVVSNLIGMVVNKYIPKGGYIASGDESDTYTPARNPWVNEQAGKTYVTIPLSEDLASSPLLNFGGKADINVTKKTTSQTTQQEDGTITTITSEKKYQFMSVIICDVLNSDQESIYPQYAALAAIPAGERLDYIRTLLQSDAFASSVTPAYIRIKIDAGTAEEIGDFSSKDVRYETFSLKNADEIDVTTDAKREFAAEARALSKTIQQAISLNMDTESKEN